MPPSAVWRRFERIVKQIRAAWPEVKIILRGDSGFCRNELMSWCESNDVDFVFGMARNQKLRKIIGKQMHEATRAVEADRQTGAGIYRIPIPARRRRRRADGTGSGAWWRRRNTSTAKRIRASW